MLTKESTLSPAQTSEVDVDVSQSGTLEHLLPDASFLLYGVFSQSGFDLEITNPDGINHVVPDYFSFPTPPNLMIESGAGLSPAMVKSLFPRAFGQDVLFAGPAPSGAALVEIGSVKLVVGTVTVRHADGSQEAVKKGAVLYQGDVLVTGAGSFVKAEMRDGTKFQLGQNGEAALDQYEFDEAADVGRFEATVRVGGFYYKSGKIGELPSASAQAHTQLNTPTSIIGVRGSELEGAVDQSGETVVVHRSGVLEITDINGDNAVTLDTPGNTAVVVLNGQPAFTAEPSQQAQQALQQSLPPPDGSVAEDEAVEADAEEVAEEVVEEAVAEAEEAVEESVEEEAVEEVVEEVAEEVEEVELDEAADAEEEAEETSDEEDLDSLGVDESSVESQSDAENAEDVASNEGEGEAVESSDDEALSTFTNPDTSVESATEDVDTTLETLQSQDSNVEGQDSGELQTLGAASTNIEESVAEVEDVVAEEPQEVIAPDNPPEALADEITVLAGGAIDVTDQLLGNDSDPDAGQVLVIISVDSARPDAVTLVDGRVQFQPDESLLQSLSAGETTTETLSYTVESGTSKADADVVIVYQGSNDAPVANNDVAETNEDVPLVLAVISNDSDPDLADTLVITSVDGGTALGVITITDDGQSLLYEPSQSLSEGSVDDVFSYTISDGNTTATATVTVTVVGVNDPPVLVSDPTGFTLELVPEAGEISIPLDAIFADSDLGSTLTVLALDTELTRGAVRIGSVLYDPGDAFDYLKEGEIGIEQFGITVQDEFGQTGQGVFSFQIEGINDAPIAVANTNAVLENGVIDLAAASSVLGDDVDAEGDALTVSSIRTGNVAATDGAQGEIGSTLVGAYGVLTLNADGQYRYATTASAVDGLAAGATAVDVFTYTITDGALSASAELLITVTGVNDAPIAVDNANAVLENGAIDLATASSVLGDDADVDGDALTVSSIRTGNVAATDGAQGEIGSTLVGAYGVLTLNADGQYRYATTASAVDGLAAGATAVDVFTYTITDGALSASAELLITVTGVNDAPVAVANTNAVLENGAIDLAAASSVLGDDADVDGDALTVSSIRTGNVAATDGAQGEIGSTLVGAYGVLTLNADGQYRYATTASAVDGLAAGATAVDVFTYTITDGALSASAELLITVTGVNDAPVAVANTNAVLENGAIDLAAASSVLGDDADVDGDALTVSSIRTGNVAATDGAQGEIGSTLVGAYGVLTLNADGQYRYATTASAVDGLAAGATAVDVFTYTITDGALSASAELLITVTGVNDAPVAVANTNAVLENGAIDLAAASSVLGDDADVDGDALTVSSIRTGNVAATDGAQGEIGSTLVGAYGVLTLNADGQYRYATTASAVDGLAAGATAVDVFTYTITDGALSASAELLITVTGVNDAPVAVANTNAVLENGAIDLAAASSVLGDDADVDGDALTVSSIRTGNVEAADGTEGAIGGTLVGTYGTLTLNADGQYSYVATASAVDGLAAGITAVDVFTYTITDGALSASAELQITVTGVNDAPIALSDTNAVLENGSIDLAAGSSLLVDDSDIDGDALTVSSIRTGELASTDGVDGTVGNTLTGTYGALTLNEDGSYSYSATASAVDGLAAGMTAVDVFTYTITDGALSASAELQITVTGVNDAPIALSDTNAVLENGSIDLAAGSSLLVDDSDIDGDALTVASIRTGELASTDGVDGTVGNTLTGTYGALTLNEDGSYSYSATASAVDGLAAGMTAVDVFTYTITDGALSASAELQITVTGVNDAPIALSDTNAVLENGSIDLAAGSSLLVDDSDIDGDALTVASIRTGELASTDGVDGTVGNTLTGTYGALTLNEDGSYSYSATASAVDGLAGGVTVVDVFTYMITDGIVSTSAELIITVTGVNDAPILAGAGGSLSFTEGGSAAVIDSAVSLSDVDDADITSASITISSGFVSSEDVLAFTDANGISGSWNSESGVLTLSGSATKAQYEAAQESVTYQNTNTEDPNNGSRTVSWLVNDGAANSSAITSTISVSDVNDAPVLADAGGTLSFTEDSPAAVIDSAVSLSDVDDADITSATIAISSGHVLSEDVLAFTDTSEITGSWDEGTGELTLSGDATTAQYEAALESVTYQNTNTDDPNNGSRTVSWVVNDGTANSSAITSTISVNDVNDAPILAGAGGTLSFTEGGGAAVIDSDVGLSDVDDTNIESATITISDGRVSSEDVLAFTNTSDITGSWDSDSGVLTLSGSATTAQYEAALESVTYQNTNTDDPNNGSRTVSWVVNDGTANSSAITSTISVNDVNDAPILAGAGGTLSFTEGGGAAVIDSDVGLSDVDDTNIESATITISDGRVSSEDVLAFTNTSDITGSWDSDSGVLTLSGSATTAQYEAALESVTYQNTNTDDPNNGSRTVSWVVNDGTANSSAITSTISVNDVNDAPILAGAGGTLSFSAGDSATIIDSALDVSDVDDTNIEGATITISGSAYLQSEDVLAFTGGSGISGSYVAGDSSGVLTLSGSATKAQYEAALESVTYQNTNTDDPNNGSRTVSWLVNDGTANSSAITSTISVSDVNDAPILAGAGGTLSFTEGGGAAVIDSDVGLSDVDDTNIESATITISDGRVSSEDVLAFTNTSDITGSWDSDSGVLTLSGSATTAQYEAALESVTYQNTNTDDPNNGSRTVSWVVNDGTANSSAITSTISVSDVNDAPILAGAGGTLSFTEGGGAAVIDSDVGLSDVDDTNIESATITISDGRVSSEDVLAFTNTSDITGSWDSDSGVLTLSGSATTAQYEAALESVTYQNTNTDDPNNGSRTVSWVVNDGTANSSAITSTISVSDVNDAPILAGAGGTLSFTEGGGAAVIDSDVGLSDVDDTNIESATITISDGRVSSEDVLAFTNTSDITGSWDSDSGVLTLSGSATTAQYEAALESVTYQNTNTDDPNNGSRTVSWVVNDGTANSSAITSTISVSDVNDAPILAGAGGTLSFTEGGGAAVIDSDVGLSDVDDTNIESATITISDGRVSSEDVLAFTNTSDITGSWDSDSGVLTLSGSATTAQYEAALESVTYQNTNTDDPNNGSRTVSWVVNDGTANSSAITSTISVSDVNDAPILAGAGGTLSFTEGGGAAVIDSDVGLSDVDDTNIESATITISDGRVSSEDVLAFTNTSDITGSWDSDSGVLTLSGSATTAQYEAALESVTYQNTNTDDPNNGSRTVSWVVNDGTANSSAITSTISVSDVNDAPILAGAGGTLSFTEGGGAAVIDSDVGLSDVDDTNIESATITISDGRVSSEDVLAFTNTSDITGSWDSDSGVLTLSGSATTAQYEAALESVTYQNTNTDDPNNGSRTVSWVVNDGTANSSAITSTISVSDVNDAPILAGAGGTLSFTEGGGAAVIDSDVGLSDVDDTNIESATITISDGRVSSEDVLAFTNTSDITGSWDSDSGVLTLSGSATTAQYEAALESVTYQNTNTDDPNNGSRTVSWVVNDGTANSSAITSTISVSDVNDAPILAGAGGTLSFTEGGGAAVIDSDVGLSDVDDTNIESATITISDGRVSSEDVLAFTNTSDITGSWDSDSGVLTLSGSATTAQYEAALESVTYQNTNTDDPNNGSRTVSWVVNDGTANSSAITSTISVSDVNDAPILAGAGGTLSFTEGGGAAVIDSDVGLSDVDDTNIESATITISDGRVSSEDVLAFTNTSDITGSWDSDSGVLTLSGSATTAQYEAALESVTYQNTNTDDPNNGSRTVSWVVNDGTANSSAITSTISVSDVNDAPILAGAGGTLSFTEGGGAAVIDSDVGLSDVDDTNIESATITISDGRVSSEDVLAFTNTSDITGSWDSDSGVLTLSGSATTAQYEAALESVTYQNTNTDDPNNGSRTVSWVVNDGTANSSAITSTISVNDVNDAPILAGAGGTLSFTEGGGAAVIDSDVGLSDVDDTNIESATITISDGRVSSEDVLAFTNTSDITGSWDSDSGVLTLSGSATTAQYEAALESVTYQNTNTDDPNNGSRTVSWVVNDGTANSSAITSTISVSDVNDAPILAGAGGTLSFTEGGGAAVIDSDVGLSDVDDTNIESATITISDGRVSSEDVLAFTNTSDITGSWDSDSGVLTLSGSATTAQYEAALESVTYQNTNTDDPNNGSRTVSWLVNDGTANSSAITSTISVSDVNDAPILAGAGGTLSFSAGDSATIIDSALDVSDVDDTNIEGATITISGSAYLQSEDVLAFTGGSGISGSYVAGDSSGVLTLSGSATKAQYEAALESVTYFNSEYSAGTTGTRTITWVLSDGEMDSSATTSSVNVQPFGSGRFYEPRPHLGYRMEDSPPGFLADPGGGFYVVNGGGDEFYDAKKTDYQLALSDRRLYEDPQVGTNTETDFALLAGDYIDLSKLDELSQSDYLSSFGQEDYRPVGAEKSTALENVDFSTLDQLTNIGELDMLGEIMADSLSLTFADVFELVGGNSLDAYMPANDHKALVINGDSEDALILNGVDIRNQTAVQTDIDLYGDGTTYALFQDAGSGVDVYFLSELLSVADPSSSQKVSGPVMGTSTLDQYLYEPTLDHFGGI